MNRGLVVVTPTDGGRELLREAGEYAAGADAELVLLAVTPQEAYSETRAAVAAVGSSDAVHSLNQAEGSAERQARRLAREAFAELDVSYDVVAAVGDESDRIFEVAAERDCDHLFLAGRRRSPTGKALFGDRTQRALLNFDGPVTVILGGEE